MSTMKLHCAKEQREEAIICKVHISMGMRLPFSLALELAKYASGSLMALLHSVRLILHL